MWMGVRIAVPIAVVIASLIIQTHFTYAYQAGIVFVAGVVGFVTRDVDVRGARWRPVAIWSVRPRRAVLGPAADRPVRRHREPRHRARRGEGSTRRRDRGGRSGRRRSRLDAAVLVATRRCARSCSRTTASAWPARWRPWRSGCSWPAASPSSGTRAGAPAARAVGIASRRRPRRRARSPRRGSRSRPSGWCRRTTTGRGRSPPSSRWPSWPVCAPCRRSPWRCVPGRHPNAGRCSVGPSWWSWASPSGRAIRWRRSPRTRSRRNVSVAHCAPNSPPPSMRGSWTTTSRSTCRVRSSPTTIPT